MASSASFENKMPKPMPRTREITAGRVLFIRDGAVFHQIYRGNDTDEQLYQKISDTLTLLATGGDRR